MRVIESTDLFGTNFNFSVFQQTTFKTYFGGLLTIFCLGICIVFTIFFGSDFFNRTNPKILLQYVQPKKMGSPVILKGKIDKSPSL